MPLLCVLYICHVIFLLPIRSTCFTVYQVILLFFLWECLRVTGRDESYSPNAFLTRLTLWGWPFEVLPTQSQEAWARLDEKVKFELCGSAVEPPCAPIAFCRRPP